MAAAIQRRGRRGGSTRDYNQRHVSGIVMSDKNSYSRGDRRRQNFEEQSTKLKCVALVQ